MPVIAAENQRKMYEHFPQYSLVRHHEGLLYLFHSGPGLDPIFRQELYSSLSTANFSHLDKLPEFMGGRANEGRVGILQVNGAESVMLKRTRYSLSELRNIARGELSRMQQINRQEVPESKEAYGAESPERIRAVIESSIQTTSYYRQTNTWFSAAEAYRKAAATDPAAPSREIAFEECLGIFIRRVRNPKGGLDKEYWTITRYYPPVNWEGLSPAEQDEYVKAEQLIRMQYRYLVLHTPYSTLDPQFIVTRRPDGSFEGRLIDLEFLHSRSRR